MFFRSVIFASVVSCALENFVLKPKVSRQEEYRSKLNPDRQNELQRLVDEYKHSQEKFDSTGEEK